MKFKIGSTYVGNEFPTYFIADIAANHDGNLNKAKELIHLCAEAGANAAKFQHFTADTIVSDFGFQSMGGQFSHQKNWKKSVFEVYKDASLNRDWTPVLKQTCEEVGIDFFTSPYSIELVDYVDEYIPAFKIGSGDITWHEIVSHIAKKNKPVILATGASNINEVTEAINVIKKENKQIVIMQCNTNYTGADKNYSYINLNVLKTYKKNFPECILGLSDHTPGHTTVLGSIALGARVIEKHFTDDTNKDGPDHKFSMDPNTWRDMVDQSRSLEKALGNIDKKIEENEFETVILQRRSIRVKKNIAKNSILKRDDLEILRPCPRGSIPPSEIANVIGKRISRDIQNGEHLCWEDLTQQ